MELSMRELNELIYCIDVARKHGQLLGTTVADNLAVRLRDELDSRLEMELWDNTLLDGLDDEADEDALHMLTSFPIDEPFTSEYKTVKERGWITQAMLDYVDANGAATFTEMNEFYKFITGGSNSFTHILQSLKTPYKNRKTQRYLAKEGKRGSDAKWIVKIANPSNWVVVNN
jgi:hypothetical protein